MSYSQAILKAKTPEEYERAKIRIRNLKLLSIGSMVFVFLPTTLYIIIVKEMDFMGKLMLYIRAVSMFVPTIICFPICL
jgi:hypothetical protein